MILVFKVSSLQRRREDGQPYGRHVLKWGGGPGGTLGSVPTAPQRGEVLSLSAKRKAKPFGRGGSHEADTD